MGCGEITGIAISGKQFSGKSTQVKLLAEALGADYDVHTISLASPVKEAVYKVLESAGVDMQGDWKSRHRGALQILGTDVIRKYDDRTWIRIFLKQLDASDADLVLNDDVRFINEAEAMKNEGFFLVRLEASDELRASRGQLVETGHQSETELDNWMGWDLVLYQTEKTKPEDIRDIILNKTGLSGCACGRGTSNAPKC